MNKTVTTIITIFAAMLAVAIPVFLSVQQAQRSGFDAEANRTLGYAQDVLRRTDNTADQVYNGINELLKVRAADPCSEAHRAVMRTIDLVSTYIQTIGYVSGNRLLCSSIGMYGAGLPIGPADYTTLRGYSVRYNVAFPFLKGNSFIVIERSGYAAVIHKDLLVDTAVDGQDVSLATFTHPNSTVLASRGFIKPQWLERLNDSDSVSFVDEGYVVAVVRSTRYFTSAIAAVPVARVDRRVRDIAMYSLPIGAATGLVLAVAVFYLARAQRAMPAVIKSALRRNEFVVLYQPIVDLRTGRWVGAEALIRWSRRNGEIMRPDLFIPIAEETGLIRRITERVTEIVARDVIDLFKQHPDFHIAVNLSAADLKTSHTVELLQRMTRNANASPKNFVVEATERGFLHADTAREVIREIRSSGIRVAVDDFGTGYSSLSYLETFELDYLKIDKSFVDTLGAGAATSHVALHVIEMAKDLKLEMVAEGVETETQANFLRGQGVQFAQGWLFGKPMTVKDLLAGIAAHADSKNA